MQLIVDDLTQRRGGRRVIDGLSFRVSSGEALVLLGANGTGKTTLMRTLAGFLAPDSGSVRLDGGIADTPVGEQCHFVGHLNGLKSNLTVAENLVFWAEYLTGQPLPSIDGRVVDALEAFAIGGLARIPAGYLSAGQKRRVALARLLVVERPLWLLDEPTASLDTASAKQVSRAITAHTASGGLAIVATHLPLDLEAARELRLDPVTEAA
ncbi:MAG: heme ABC exporter ATP-binding protein CcmA [Hyphomicrobium sp.]